MEHMKQQVKIQEAIDRIKANGGQVRPITKTIVRPNKPGLKVLSAMDCLVNYGGYRVIEEY